MMLFLLLFTSTHAAIPPSCKSWVYCRGPLLHTVQMAYVFNDSKTFVDYKIKESEDAAVNNYNAMMHSTSNTPTHEQITEFVSANFEKGPDLAVWTPHDFIAEPKFLNKIEDLELRKFGKEIVALWKLMARKTNPEVGRNPKLYSLIPLPNGFIAPGGKFLEIYYWDTYWIIHGILISEMTTTARGMIENLMFLVKLIGHVPHCSRVYCIQRSHPPMLSKMVLEYMAYTNDTNWLRQNIHTLEQELRFWRDNRCIRVTKNGTKHLLYQYNAPSYGPRPDSYQEDFVTASQTPNPTQTYVELKSGAETGWDFSSRWFFDAQGGNKANLTQIQTTRVIPVDLNSYLYDAFENLSKLYNLTGNCVKARIWARHALDLEEAVNAVLWNDEVGIWLDFDIKLNKHRDFFYVSNIAPLYVNLGNIARDEGIIRKILKYLKINGIDNFAGGTPTSLIQTGEEFDMPNAWAPFQAMIIQGLRNTKNKEANQLAEKFANIWINANYIGFQKRGEMFEKYDANILGKFGAYGKYIVEAGFGWTNGVVLELLDTYGSILKAK